MSFFFASQVVSEVSQVVQIIFFSGRNKKTNRLPKANKRLRVPVQTMTYLFYVQPYKLCVPETRLNQILNQVLSKSVLQIYNYRSRYQAKPNGCTQKLGIAYFIQVLLNLKYIICKSLNKFYFCC